MKILVTGGCGYKGSILVPKLLSAGYDVTVVDAMWFGNFLQPHPKLQIIKADIRNLKSSWFEDATAIIHLASVSNDPCSELNPKLSWEVGALATMQLADLAAKYQMKQFIYASSGSVYGVSDVDKVTEETELNPITEYNKNKMVSERVLLSYASQMQIQIIRPATVCGFSPRMRLDVSVNMLTMQALTKGKMTVFGGNQIRPNIHIEDITDLYLFFLENPHHTGIYNAGFENLSIFDIAKTIASIIPADIQVTDSNDPRSYRVHSDKLLQLGFKPKKNVKQAISELIETFRQGILKDEDHFYNIRTMKALTV